MSHFQHISTNVWRLKRIVFLTIIWRLQRCISMGLKTLRPRQNGQHFPDNFFKWIFFNENVWISIKISLKFVAKGPINDIPTFVQIMAWRRQGDKPLSESMLVSLMTHICVTQPRCVTGDTLHASLYTLTSQNGIRHGCTLNTMSAKWLKWTARSECGVHLIIVLHMCPHEICIYNEYLTLHFEHNVTHQIISTSYTHGSTSDHIHIIISYLGVKSWDLQVCDRAPTITHVDREKKNSAYITTKCFTFSWGNW